VDRRSEALAQLLENALSERSATPTIELLHAIPIPVAVVQVPDLRVLASNDAMTRMFHRPAAAGLTISALLPPAHPLSDPRPYQAAAQRRPHSSVIVIDGQTWEWFIRPLGGEGSSAAHLLTGLLAQPATPPDLDLAQLREMSTAKTEFLNRAAHELRTPLSVILGYGSLLAQGGLSEDHQRLAGARIYEKARQLSRLIMDMHLVGRFDELGPSLEKEELDLVELLEPMVAEQQRRFADLAIDLRLDVIRAPFRGNSYWLHLALRELLDNAIRFRPSPTGRIDVSLGHSGSSWSISVLDDGFGIDPQHRGQLFKRFARIETEATSHLVGLGIGLYIVQEVARAHGGRVLVDSQPGTGSEFTLELPRR
jgi:signal transduction histidine kinase